MQIGTPPPAQPLQGQFGGGRGSGKLAIGDSILKGFIQGHEAKAQKKAAQATATISAANAATEAAHQKYQDALVAANGDVNSPDAKAAYAAYTDVFTKGKQAIAQFVIPDDTQKKPKGAKDKIKGAFSSIGEFMSANPHVVPQLALLSMQPQKPGMTPESKQAQVKQAEQADQAASAHLELAEQQRKANAQKVYDQFSGLSEEQRAALPADQQAAYRSAQNVLYPPNRTGATKLYKLADGTTGYFHPDAVPDGAQPVLPNSMAGGSSKIGTFPDYATRWAKENNLDPQKLTVTQIDALKKRYAWDSQHDSTSSTTVSPGIDSTTTTSSRTAGGAPPFPSVSGGGITRPPAAAAAGRRGGGGGVTRPPAAASGQPSLRRSQITRQVEDKKKGMYDKAKAARDKALLVNNAKLAGDPVAKKKADDLAEQQFQQAGAAAETWYNQQVRDIGGTPGADNKKKAKNDGPVKYYQGHAYKQDPQTKEWRLAAAAVQ